MDPAGIITTVAGNGTAGFSGDGGPANAAELKKPSGVAIDSAGNLYISDGGNHRIRKVDPAGIITTVAGNGTAGFSGDGGAANAAELKEPSGVAIDSAGNLYISDGINDRIRKVDLAGIITTVAGNGTRSFSGGDGGRATAALLSSPYQIAADSAGNLYVTESGIHRVRKVDPAGIITTVAGNGTAGFSGDGGLATAAELYEPSGVAIDSAGNLYIADGKNHLIRKVDLAGIINTVAGNGTEDFKGDGGPATAASLAFPGNIAVDGAGNLYIVDAGNDRIRKVDSAGIISTVFSSGIPDGSPFRYTYILGGVTVDGAGSVYFLESQGFVVLGANGFGQTTYRIKKIDTAGIITTAAESAYVHQFGMLGQNQSSEFTASSVAVDRIGNIYVTGSSSIRKIDPAGMMTTLAGTGARGFSGDGGPANAAALDSPEGLAVDNAGNLYIADSGNGRIRKVSAINLTQPAVFDGQTVGTASAAQSVSLRNSGTAPYDLQSITIQGDFSVSHDCGARLAAGAACRLQIIFTPAATGSRSGVLTVTGSNGDPLIANLSGRGTDPVFPVTSNLTLRITAPKKAKAGKVLAYRFVIANKSKVKVPGTVAIGELGNTAVYKRVPRFCSFAGQNLTCQLGEFNGRKKKAFTIKVKPSATGVLSFSATIAGQANEVVPANNTSAISTRVN